MPTYILLVKWTQAGIQTAKEIPKRVEQSRDTFKSVGGQIKDIYFTFGRYDLIVTVEAPSDDALGQAVLTTGGRGAVSIETLKAFPEAVVYDILQRLP